MKEKIITHMKERLDKVILEVEGFSLNEEKKKYLVENLDKLISEVVSNEKMRTCEDKISFYRKTALDYLKNAYYALMSNLYSLDQMDNFINNLKHTSLLIRNLIKYENV